MSTPSVTIAMAMYKPNITWLREQLISLNKLDYPNLNLIVWNDCPTDDNHEELFAELITKFPFRVIKGKENLGSNGAFEQLTRLITTEYIAYCDQDDIWLPEKIGILVKEAQEKNADLVCTDTYVIDANSNVVADSITKVRPRQVFYEGPNQFAYLLTKNFVTGCTTLVKTDFAKSTLPFPQFTVHDWWLALNAAFYGKLEILRKSLIKYRIHGNNQTGMLNGIKTKNDYYNKYIVHYNMQIREIDKRLACNYKALKEAILWSNARICYFRGKDILSIFVLLKYINLNKNVTLFEIIGRYLPNILFEKVVSLGSVK